MIHSNLKKKSSCEFESRSWLGVFDTILCDKSLSVTCSRSVIFPGYATPVSSTNKTGCHDIVEVLLKVALNTITPNNPIFQIKIFFRNEINEDDESHKAYATPLLKELLLNIDKKAILFPCLEEIAHQLIVRYYCNMVT